MMLCTNHISWKKKKKIIIIINAITNNAKARTKTEAYFDMIANAAQ